MTTQNKTTLLLAILSLIFLSACQNKKFKDHDFTAYFGGEIQNPTSQYVILFKDNLAIDSILLDEKNRFFKKYDSLAPGMYTFKNEPEYQHIYFDKNDSLMLSLNARDFDQTLVFGGRGDLKNNFLIDLYLKNSNDRTNLFKFYDKKHTAFRRILDSIYKDKKDFYNQRKEAIQWNEDFDMYARAFVNYNHYVRLELYPYIHNKRTGVEIAQQLPKDYYNYRNLIDLNDEKLISFQPFTSYLTAMLNNIVYEQCLDDTVNFDLALHCNIEKLKQADKLFQSSKIKNMVLNNIAFMYMLEDQNLLNNQAFLNEYFKLSTDKSNHNEIVKISENAQALKPGSNFPDEIFTDIDGNKKSLKSLTNKQTVIYFWSTKSISHLESAHKKAIEYQQKFPNTNFLSVNIDDDFISWKKALANYNFDKKLEFHNTNYKNSKEKWVITKIHRTIILNADGTIKNAFANLFDADFDKNLQ